MLLPRIALVIALIATVACSSRYRKETLGSAPIALGKSVAVAGVPVAGSHDQLEVAYLVTTPRAMQLQFLLRCPGGERKGTIGETWERYQQRRLGEIEQERRQQAQTKAKVIGAVLGTAETKTQAQVGENRAEIHADVDGQAIGQAVAARTTPAAKLPAWDVGAQRMREKFALPGGAAGRCSMSLWSERADQRLDGVSGSIHVVQLVDKSREKQAKRAAADDLAMTLRADLRASLITNGADPEHREKVRLVRLRKKQEAEAARLGKLRKRQEAEALRRRKLEAQRRSRAQRDTIRSTRDESNRVSSPLAPPNSRRPEPGDSAAAVVTLRQRQVQLAAALKTRQRLVAWCLGNGADPYYRARLRQAAYDERQAEDLARARKLAARKESEKRRRLVLEAQLGNDLRTRTELVASFIAAGADPEYRRKKNEAELLAYEERVRQSRYAQIRKEPQSPEVSIAAPSTTEGAVVVRASAVRPARPAAPKETRPVRPSAESSWIPGFHEWRGSAWVWIPGVWSTPPVADAIWVPSIEIELGGKIVIQPGSWRTRSGHRVRKRKQKGRVHDHR